MNKLLFKLMFLCVLSSPLEPTNFQFNINLKNTKKENKKNKITSEDINEIVLTISENFFLVNTLKKQKEYYYNILNTSLKNMSESKVNLSESKIENFKNYNLIIAKEEQNSKNIMKNLSNEKSFMLIQKELLSKNPSLNSVYNKLNYILNSQLNLIYTLYKTIFGIRSCIEVLS